VATVVAVRVTVGWLTIDRARRPGGGVSRRAGVGESQFTATRMPALLQRSSIVTGVTTGAIAIYDYVDVQRRIEDVKEQSELIAASVGAGIWILIVGGVVVRNMPKS
jgi:hypothetical protein